jgi:hypothetical protein
MTMVPAYKMVAVALPDSPSTAVGNGKKVTAIRAHGVHTLPL